MWLSILGGALFNFWLTLFTVSIVSIFSAKEKWTGLNFIRFCLLVLSNRVRSSVHHLSESRLRRCHASHWRQDRQMERTGNINWAVRQLYLQHQAYGAFILACQSQTAHVKLYDCSPHRPSSAELGYQPWCSSFGSAVRRIFLGHVCW